MNSPLNPKRTVAELKELRALTADENGAQRVAFTPTWVEDARVAAEKTRSAPGRNPQRRGGQHLDDAARRIRTSALLIGGHMDSVPNGGWLDGCLNVLAGVEILRRINAQYHGKPPVTVRLVDWADEEGARFGKSLFGSSACSGNLDMNEARGLVDKDGIRLPDALKNVGVDFERVKDSGKELKNAAAYLELHIEQGPVLLDLDLPLGAVLGTFGVERHAITFHGQAAHSGSTPMNRRKDAFLAAAKMSPEIYRIAERSHGGVCTIGSCTTKPGIVTSVVAECRITLDQRHLDAAALAKMLQEAKGRQRKIREGRQRESFVGAALANRPAPVQRRTHCAVRRSHPRNLRQGRIACPAARCTTPPRSRRAGVPTVMMFVQSLHGISHNKIEDTKEEHLELCVTAFDKLAEKAMKWIQQK